MSRVNSTLVQEVGDGIHAFGIGKPSPPAASLLVSSMARWNAAIAESRPTVYGTSSPASCAPVASVVTASESCISAVYPRERPRRNSANADARASRAALPRLSPPFCCARKLDATRFTSAMNRYRRYCSVWQVLPGALTLAAFENGVRAFWQLFARLE